MYEQWCDVVGYDGLYLVSDHGNIWSMRQHKVLRPAQPGTTGYMHVVLSDRGGTAKTWMIHRIVADAWVPGKAPGLEVEHIDTDRRNNRASNLRWTTHKANCRNRLTRAKMSGCGVWQCDMAGNKIAYFVSQHEAAEETGIHQSCISKVCNGKGHHAGGYKWAFDNN